MICLFLARCSNESGFIISFRNAFVSESLVRQPWLDKLVNSSKPS